MIMHTHIGYTQREKTHSTHLTFCKQYNITWTKSLLATIIASSKGWSALLKWNTERKDTKSRKQMSMAVDCVLSERMSSECGDGFRNLPCSHGTPDAPRSLTPFPPPTPTHVMMNPHRRWVKGKLRVKGVLGQKTRK